MKHLKSVLKYSITLVIAVGLLIYVFRDIDLREMFENLRHADFTFVYISVVLSLISHFFRAYRWTLMFKPIGFKVNSLRAYVAVLAGYFANLLLPRMGEVTRCAILKRTDNIPIPASLGTVISERLLDLLILIAVIISTVIIEFKTLKDFIFSSIDSAYQNFNLNKFLIMAGTIAILFLLVIVFFIRHRNNMRSWGLYQKLRPLAYDLINGLNSIRRIQNKWGFFFSTFMIWILYYLMSYIIVFSFPSTSSLGFSAGLSILMAGGLGMSAPVQGGIGTYHAFVSGVLILYGISKEDGLLFATLLHTSQFISILFFGGSSLIISLFLSKKSHGNQEQDQNAREGIAVHHDLAKKG